MFKQLGTFAILAVCLFAIVLVMGGCGGDDPPPPPIIDPPPPPYVSFVSVSPENESYIQVDATITVTFDSAPEGVVVRGEKPFGGDIATTVTTEGSTVTISGPFTSLQGEITLWVEWTSGYSTPSRGLTYFVIPDPTGSYTLDSMVIFRHPDKGLPIPAGFALPPLIDDPVTGTLTFTQDNRFSMSVTRPGHGTAEGSGSWKADNSRSLTLSTAPGSNFGGTYMSIYDFDENELSLEIDELVISNAPSGNPARLWWRKK